MRILNRHNIYLCQDREETMVLLRVLWEFMIPLHKWKRKIHPPLESFSLVKRHQPTSVRIILPTKILRSTSRKYQLLLKEERSAS